MCTNISSVEILRDMNEIMNYFKKTTLGDERSMFY